MINDKLKATFSKWDSDIFECRVGILDLQEMPDRKQIKDSNQEFEVIFVKVNGWHCPETQSPHHRFLGLDWLYDMEVPHPPHKVIGEPAVTQLHLPMASHMALAERAFLKINRFASDMTLAWKIPEFYRSWIDGKSIWVLDGREQEDAFMLKLLDHDDVPRISLIAVDEKYRGLGLGERLILGVMNRLEGAKAWRVKVSAKNWRALRFYEGLGFRVKSVQTAFHMWIQ